MGGDEALREALRSTHIIDSEGIVIGNGFGERWQDGWQVVC
jgi:hypothetical protein